MAVAIDQANAGTASNDALAATLAVTTTQAIAAGGFVVASVGWWHATATLTSLTNDGAALVWAIAVQGKNSTTNPSSAIVYAQVPAGRASGMVVTANYSTSVNGRQIGITSFTGVATSSEVDVTAAVVSGGAVTPWATGTMASAAGSVLVGCCHMDENGTSITSTITSPSIEALDFNDGTNTAVTTGYRIEASGGSFTVAGTWSSASGASHATVGAAFKAAVATVTDRPLRRFPLGV